MTSIRSILLLGLLAGTAMAKPNVLLTSIDDLNDWIGCMGGHPQAQTPNIDRLAERGVLFNNAHCQSTGHKAYSTTEKRRRQK